MTVCGYNYRLQSFYDRDVSSGINALFCAYFVYSTGIETPLQKMHDNEVSKVYMLIFVKEVRAHQSVMAGGMVFGVVVLEVGASRGPVNLEVALAGVIPDPVEVHINFL